MGKDEIIVKIPLSQYVECVKAISKLDTLTTLIVSNYRLNKQYCDRDIINILLSNNNPVGK